MPSPDERKWVQQAARGDRNAFAHLVDCYLSSLRRWLFTLTGKEHVAEDISQEAFLKAWIALPTYREEGSFRAWLFQIARRCWLDTERSGDTCQKLAFPEEVPAKPEDPLTDMIVNETQQQLQNALAALPPNYRAAYLLWTQEELPYAEIAEILGITEDNARWRVFQARRRLLQLLEPYLQCRDL